jgi:hypothetical protein
MKPRRFVTLGALFILGTLVVHLRYSRAGEALPGPAASGIPGSTWIPIGPAPLLGFFGGGVSGRATSIAVNPHNIDDVWLGTANGGVWHTLDAGLGWTPESDQMPPLAIGALALDCPGGVCTTIYAGTGENAIRRDTYAGGGLLLGTIANGHVSTWLPRGVFSFTRGSIYNVVLDPTTSGSSKTLYVTFSSGVTASSTESTVTAPEPGAGYGLYKSTNQGLNWSRLTVFNIDARPTDLQMDPGNHNVLWAGFLGTGVFKSVDGGANWCPQNPGVPRSRACPVPPALPNPTVTPFDHVEITMWNSNILYATFGTCTDPLLESCVPLIYQTLNGGTTWTRRNVIPDQDCAGYSRYTHALTVDPRSSSTVFVGGIRLCQSNDAGATFHTSDKSWGGTGGQSNPWSNTVHYDHHAVVFHPLDAERVYEASDGGFAVSYDGGDNWYPRNDDLQTTLFQSIASSPANSRPSGGFQDNGCAYWVAHRQWNSFAHCGDGGFSIVDQVQPSRWYGTTNYGTTDVLPWRRNNSAEGFVDNGILASDSRAFYPPFIQGPPPAHALYFGTNRLYRDLLATNSWLAISPVLSSSPQPEIWGGVNVITAIAVAPSDPTRIFIGYYGGEIFTTNTACPMPSCWLQIGAGSGLPQAPVTRIAVDPAFPGRAYVAYSGFAAGAHLYRTLFFNGNWFVSAVSGSGSTSLPPTIPINTISIEPSATQNLWVGTDDGVFKSTDSAATWVRFSAGLPRVPVYEISIDESRQRVYAATHGRGAFMISNATIDASVEWVSQVFGVPLPENIQVHGWGFLPNELCTMELFRQNGDVCASGPLDAASGVIETEKDGFLTTSKALLYDQSPVAWACKGGICIGGAFAVVCHSADNPLAGVRVHCGGQVASVGIGPAFSSLDPWSTILLTGLGAPQSASVSQGVTSGGAFDVIATSRSAGGTARALCSAHVAYTGTDSQEAILRRAADGLTANVDCIHEGLTATVSGFAADGEDPIPNEFEVALSDPGLNASQLVTSIRSGPGGDSPQCFALQGIGIPSENQLTGLRLTVRAATAGSAGGEISIVERSILGDCAVTVPIGQGWDGARVAKALETQFHASGIPGPSAFCPSRHNPRDVALDGSDSIVFAVASRIIVCNSDPDVGFGLGPRDLSICFADSDCDDGAICNGGETCAFGICRPGAAPSCDDADPCTLDQCQSAGCVHQPVILEPVGDTLQVTHDLASATTVLGWTPSSSADHSNTYRGSIPPNLMGSRPQPYDQTCFESDDAAGDGATTSRDSITPPIGWGFYYLVDSEGQCGESILGHDSAGSSIPNASTCPTPP